ncbi:MAG: O-acetyltransferase WecH [Sodalis sp.]|nr:MAG: O-acetyltransferase WecH [Sodalis sp.]
MLNSAPLFMIISGYLFYGERAATKKPAQAGGCSLFYSAVGLDIWLLLSYQRA